MSTTSVKQVRPWAPSVTDRAMTGLSVVLAILTAVIIVAVTPMKGKLAYFFLFFIAWFVIDSIFVVRKMGAKGIRDGLAALGIIIEDTAQGPRWSISRTENGK